MTTLCCSSKAMAWWKADECTMPKATSTPFLRLPGELRNIIYETVVVDTKQLVIRNGNIVEHPLSQVNRQLRSEFGSVFFSGSSTVATDKRPTPENITLQLWDFDFSNTMEMLDCCSITPGTKFTIDVKITKQLLRDDWKKLWPWVQYCDVLMPKASYQGKTLSTRYDVDLELGKCNPYAASHELYVETLPYILGGAGGPHGMFSGYEEIGKIRSALRDALARG